MWSGRGSVHLVLMGEKTQPRAPGGRSGVVRRRGGQMSSRESSEFNQVFFSKLVEKGSQLVEKLKTVNTRAVVVTPLKAQGVIADRLDL